ncbi:MAG: hypothetical protein U1E76_24900 [Planctomycetota bacterium]
MTMTMASIIRAATALLLSLTGCQQPRLVIPAPDLLPNGWRLSPVGSLVPLPELPLGCDLTPDGRYAAIACCGAGNQSLTVLDLERREITCSVPMHRAWLGVAFFDDGRQLIASAGNDNELWFFAHAAGALNRSGAVSLGPPWEAGGRIWPAGIAVDRERAASPTSPAARTGAIRVVDLHARS